MILHLTIVGLQMIHEFLYYRPFQLAVVVCVCLGSLGPSRQQGPRPSPLVMGWGAKSPQNKWGGAHTEVDSGRCFLHVFLNFPDNGNPRLRECCFYTV